MITIYLIRHGEVTNPKGIIYGRTVDVPLDPIGYDQLNNLGKYFANKGIIPNAIYTSPLMRAIESSKTLAQQLGDPEIKIEPDLIDVNHSGLEARTISWMQSVGDLYNYKGEEMLGTNIEMPEEQSKRILGVIEKIKEKHKNEVIFVMSHGHPTTFAIWRLFHKDAVFPSIGELEKEGYSLGKGEPLRLTFDDKGKLVEFEFVLREKQFGKEKER